MLIQQFNTTIDQWIACLDNYTLEQLCKHPDPDSWSLGQVYIHIIDDTTFHIEQAHKALMSDAENSERTMHKNARVLFAQNAFPDMQFTNPSNSLGLRQPQSKEELQEALLNIKNKVNSLYAGTDISASNGKTEHPGLGFFNAAEWLLFTEIHMRHHFRQKKRIDDNLSWHK